MPVEQDGINMNKQPKESTCLSALLDWGQDAQRSAGPFKATWHKKKKKKRISHVRQTSSFFLGYIFGIGMKKKCKKQKGIPTTVTRVRCHALVG